MSRNWRTALFAGSAWVAISAVPAMAQEANGTAEEVEAQEGVIVVTAQRREQSIQDIPFTVNAVDADALADAGVTDVFALQTQVPGLDIRSVNPPSVGSAFNIRGLGTGVFNLGFEPSVGTFVDGIYRARSGLVAGFDFLDLERVEVLKGPQGTLFGKNTTAGLINFVSASPKFRTEGMARAEYGNNGRLAVQGVVNAPLGDTVAVRLAGGYVNDDGYIEDIASGDNYGEKDRYNLRAQLLFEPSDALSVRIIGDYAKADEFTVAPIKSQNAAANVGFNQMLAAAAGSAYPDPPLASEWQTALNIPPSLEAEDWGISGEINYEFGAVTLTSLTSYREFEDFLNEDSDYSGVDTLRSNQGQSAKTFTQEIRLSGTADVAAGLDWIIGGYYANEKIRRLNQFVWGDQVDDGLVGAFFGTVPGVGFTDNLGQDGDTYGIFAHTITNITDRFSLTAGIRHSWDKKEGFGTFTAPQSFPLPVVYDFGEGTNIPAEVDDSGISATVSLAYDLGDANIYGTYSRGYKAGGISLIRDAGGVQVGLAPFAGPIPDNCMPLFGPTITCATDDPTFRKETVDHFEAGIKSTFLNGAGRANLALFHTKVSDLQTQALQPSGTFLVVNVGSVKARGFDFDFSVYPTDGWEVSGGVVYSKVTDQNGDDIDHAPRWIGGFGTTYEFGLGNSGLNAFVHADVSFKDKYFTTNDLSQFQGAYEVANARLGIRGEDDRWELSAWCRNCFNRNYTTVDFTIPIDGGGLNDGTSILSYLGESRFYGLTAQINF